MEGLRRAIETSNPWRTTGRVESWPLGAVPRPEAGEILRRLSRPGPALLVEGPRRVGKSVLLLQALARLLEGDPKERVVYLSMDDPLLDPESAFADLEKFLETESWGSLSRTPPAGARSTSSSTRSRSSPGGSGGSSGGRTAPSRSGSSPPPRRSPSRAVARGRASREGSTRSNSGLSPSPRPCG